MSLWLPIANTLSFCLELYLLANAGDLRQAEIGRAIKTECESLYVIICAVSSRALYSELNGVEERDF